MRIVKLGPYKGETYGSVMESYIVAPLCESPIEIRFGSRLSESLRQLADRFFVMGYAVEPSISELEWPRQFLILQPQFKLQHFRYDFAVRVTTEPKPECLIECDGIEFHSSAKQKRNDLRKDDAAKDLGIPLFRFSGKQIYHEVDWCVAQTLIPLFRKWNKSTWGRV